MFVFIQSFSLGDVGGGAKILRSVADDAPVNVTSIRTGHSLPYAKWQNREFWIPDRPSLGRIDRSRFAWIGSGLETLFNRSFERRLDHTLRSVAATDVHILPHTSGSFAAVARTAARLNLRMHVSIHDDYRHTAKHHIRYTKLERELASLWSHCHTRFVISKQLGDEYSLRYGSRPFVVHTDGVHIPPFPIPRQNTGSPLHVYFMGMYNLSYAENFEVLLAALAAFNREHPDLPKPRLTMRTQGFNPGAIPASIDFHLLPFASEEVINAELATAHAAYLPLPFGPDTSDFSRFSLSTKMVTYLASETPILFHGPPDSAAGRYLSHNQAALCATSNNSQEILRLLNELHSDPLLSNTLTTKALDSARRDFDRDKLFELFWTSVAAPANQFN